MIEKLKQAVVTGTELYLDNKPAMPETIAHCCMEDGAVYMPDYILDENGGIMEIRYDKVSSF